MWYTNLPPNSIRTWEEKFQTHFTQIDLKISLANLAQLKQQK